MANCEHCGYDPCLRSPDARFEDKAEVFRRVFGAEAASILSLAMDAAETLGLGPSWPSLPEILHALSRLDEQPELFDQVVLAIRPPTGPGRPLETLSRNHLLWIRRLLRSHLSPLPAEDPNDIWPDVVRSWRERELQDFPWIPDRLAQMADLVKSDPSISESDALDLAAWSQVHGFSVPSISDLDTARCAFAAVKQARKRQDAKTRLPSPQRKRKSKVRNTR